MNFTRVRLTALLTAGIACVATVSTACSSSGHASGGSGGSAAGKAISNVTIGIGGPVSELYVPIFAQDQGILAKYGIKASFQTLNATTMLPTLSAGKVDFLSTAGVQPDVAALKGVPLKALAVWANKPDFQIVAAPGIKNVQDLRGKRIGITSTGSTTTLFAEMALRAAGMSDSDVKIVPLGNPAAQASAFASRQIDAFVAGPPATDQAVASVPGASLVVHFQDSYSWPFAELIGYMPYVTSHKDVTVKLIRALDEAVAAWKSSPEAAQATIKRELKATDAQAKSAYEASLTTLADTLRPSLANEAFLLKSIVSLAADAAAADPASMISTEYVDAAGVK